MCLVGRAVDRPVAVVEPRVEAAGDNVTLTCNVTFGAPRNSTSLKPLMSDQLPQLNLSLDDRDLTQQATYQYTNGQPDELPHIITLVGYVLPIRALHLTVHTCRRLLCRMLQIHMVSSVHGRCNPPCY